MRKCGDVRNARVIKEAIHEERRRFQSRSNRKLANNRANAAAAFSCDRRKDRHVWQASEAAAVRLYHRLVCSLGQMEVYCSLSFFFLNAPFIKRSTAAQANEMNLELRSCTIVMFQSSSRPKFFPVMRLRSANVSAGVSGVRVTYSQLQQVVQQSFAFALDEGVGAAGFGYSDPGQSGFLGVGRRGQSVK